jgi:cytochrome P450
MNRIDFPDDIDPTLPGVADPYPALARLREHEAVHWSAFLGGWVVTRYAEAVEYLRDRRFSRVGFLDLMRSRFGADTPILEFQRHELSFQDGDEHTWLKNVVGKAFSPARIAAMRPAIERLCEDRLDQLRSAGAMDIIADYSYPLPANVIATMLGVPREDWPRLREWVDGIVLSRGIVRTPEMMARGDESARAFGEYLGDLLARRRASPRDDLMSALVEAEEKGRRLSDDQLVSMVETLFAAGHATTRALVGLGMLALMRHPNEFATLKSHPEKIESAVEEMLRYDAPTQAPSPQVATDDVSIAGKTIRKGDIATVLFGAANRDPRRFAEPDRFDIARSDNEHLSFSFGAHYCLGASLARAEAAIAIGALIRRLPGLRLAPGELEFQSAGRFRGLAALHVEF